MERGKNKKERLRLSWTLPVKSLWLYFGGLESL